MKKMLYHAGRIMLAALLCTGGLSACTDDDPAPTPVDERQPLAKPVLESRNVGQKSFTVSWNAVADAAVYAYSIDAASAETQKPEYTLAYSVDFSGLEPGTTHVVRVQAVPAKDNTVYKASDFAEITVTTQPEDPEFFTFRKDWVTPVGVGIECTPTDEESVYFFINASKDGLDFKSLDDYIEDYIANNFWYGPGEWEPDGWSLFQGSTSYTDYMSLLPATDYVLVAVGVNENGAPVKTGTFEYATPPIGPVDCSFTVEMGNVSYDLASFTITPSDPYALYTIDAVPLADYAGMTDDQIIEEMLKKGYLQSYHGPNEGTITITEQDTDYGMYIFGCVRMEPTTRLYKFTFHSGVQDFDFAGDAYTEIEVTYVAEAKADWAKGYATLAAQCTPNESTAIYRTICGPAATFEALSDLELGKLVEDEWDESQWHPDGIWLFDADRRVPIGEEGMIVTLSRDSSGRSGRLNKHKFTATPFGEPPYANDGPMGSK